MIPIIYDTLLMLMLVILYFCGKEIAKSGKVFSKAGIIAILSFTLNEGLRFGRGLDYNLYGMAFDGYLKGEPIDKEFLYSFLIKLLINVGIPFQGLIIIQSFLFIIGILCLLSNFRDIIPFALPFFVLFSLLVFENLIRWYLGFSFVLLGINLLVKKKSIIYFFLVSELGAFFHVGLLPIPVIIYLIYRIKKPLISPIISIPIYIAIGLFVKSDIMLFFANYLKLLSFVSERSESYVENAERWLSSGALEIEQSSFDGLFTIIYLFVIIWFGYYLVKTMEHKYNFIYNLFVIGFMLKPLANQIEILTRYNYCLYCFGGIIASVVFVYNTQILNKAINGLLFTIILAFQLNILRSPFRYAEEKYLYVWDIGNKTYNTMYSFWINDIYQKNK